jgi:hypothetical protein
MSAGRRLSWPRAAWLASRGGRADRVRIVLTAVGAAAGTFALLAAITVAAIRRVDGPYTSAVLNQPGLHPGVVITLVLLCVPILAFAGQCSRVGAPARDRRLAALRLAGATPTDVIRVACAESGLAAALGSLVGLVGYLAGRSFAGPARVGRPLTLPTDVLPPVWALVVVVLAIPVAATASAALALRKVTVSPFGVVRRARTQPPRLAPAVLFVVGTVGLAGFTRLRSASGLADRSITIVTLGFVALFVLTGIGLVTGAASVAATIGRFVAPRARRPALLIAARRLAAAPFDTSRSNAALLLGILLGAGAQGVRSWMLTGTDPSSTFYRDTLDLVDVAVAVAVVTASAGLLVSVAEGIVSRRHSLAALTAAGTPRGVLRRAVLLETLLPLLPAALLAAMAGVLAARGVFGTSVQLDYALDNRSGPGAFPTVSIPVPWLGSAVLVVGSLALTAAMTALALVFLRRSTDPAELHTPA